MAGSDCSWGLGLFRGSFTQDPYVDSPCDLGFLTVWQPQDSYIVFQDSDVSVPMDKMKAVTSEVTQFHFCHTPLDSVSQKQS